MTRHPNSPNPKLPKLRTSNLISMMFYTSNQFGRRNVRVSSGGGIGCLIFGVLGLVATFFILKGLFYLLYWASPVLFLFALIINWRAVTDTFRNWLKSMETNPLGGLLMAALAVLAFPLFALYLFVKALGYKKMQQFQREFGQDRRPADDEFAEFEELESRPKTDLNADQPMKPPVLPEKEPEHAQGKKHKAKNTQPDEPEPPRAAEPKKPENPYDKLFE